MIDKKILDKLSMDELIELKHWISSSKPEEIETDIIHAMRRNEYNKKKHPLNKSFDLVCMAEWRIFTIQEIEILYTNGINNLDELLKFDLDRLIGASDSMKKRIDRRRQFYNLARYSDCIPKVSNNKTIKKKK